MRVKICLNLLASFFDKQVCPQYNYCGNKTGDCANGVNGTLNYLRATGPDDVLHYAWSTVGYPTVFISRSPGHHKYNVNNCVSSFRVNNYQKFMSDQEPGSVSIDGVSSNFSFALIFKNLVEFKVNPKKLPAVKAFDPDLARNCSLDPNATKDCYHVYHLNNPNLNWSSYAPFDGGIMRAYTNSSFFMNLKVSFYS